MGSDYPDSDLESKLHVRVYFDVRTHFDRANICVYTRNARDIFVIHTRSELVSAIQFFGTVKLGEDSFNSCSFHLVRSLRVFVLVSEAFSVFRGTSNTTFAEEMCASDCYEARKFRESILEQEVELLSTNPLPLLFSFAPAILLIFLPGHALLRCASQRLSCDTRRYILFFSLSLSLSLSLTPPPHTHTHTKSSYLFSITSFT